MEGQLAIKIGARKDQGGMSSMQQILSEWGVAVGLWGRTGSRLGRAGKRHF